MDKIGFRHAFRGIGFALVDLNFKIMLALFITAILGGFYFDIKSYEWLAILVISALVLSLELVNTAIEKFGDRITTEYDERIGIIKDIAAGSVLIASIFALTIAWLIFSPYLFG